MMTEQEVRDLKEKVARELVDYQLNASFFARHISMKYSLQIILAKSMIFTLDRVLAK